MAARNPDFTPATSGGPGIERNLRKKKSALLHAAAPGGQNARAPEDQINQLSPPNSLSLQPITYPATVLQQVGGQPNMRLQILPNHGCEWVTGTKLGEWKPMFSRFAAMPGGQVVPTTARRRRRRSPVPLPRAACRCS